MRISIDPARCTGHAMCWHASPQVFQVDETTGYAYIDDAEVPAGLEEQARKGAEACPERAITIEE